jgi:FtsZ-interacting cell division protein YlmF
MPGFIDSKRSQSDGVVEHYADDGSKKKNKFVRTLSDKVAKGGKIDKPSSHDKVNLDRSFHEDEYPKHGTIKGKKGRKIEKLGPLFWSQAFKVTKDKPHDEKDKEKEKEKEKEKKKEKEKQKQKEKKGKKDKKGKKEKEKETEKEKEKLNKDKEMAKSSNQIVLHEKQYFDDVGVLEKAKSAPSLGPTLRRDVPPFHSQASLYSIWSKAKAQNDQYDQENAYNLQTGGVTICEVTDQYDCAQSTESHSRTNSTPASPDPNLLTMVSFRPSPAPSMSPVVYSNPKRNSVKEPSTPSDTHRSAIFDLDQMMSEIGLEESKYLREESKARVEFYANRTPSGQNLPIDDVLGIISDLMACQPISKEEADEFERMSKNAQKRLSGEVIPPADEKALTVIVR